MSPHLIRVNDSLAVNPAFVAFVERDAEGRATLHMGVSVAMGQIGRGGPAPAVADHPKLYLTKDEADRVWAALFPAAPGG